MRLTAVSEGFRYSGTAGSAVMVHARNAMAQPACLFERDSLSESATPGNDDTSGAANMS